jgi:hypothetical protein
MPNAARLGQLQVNAAKRTSSPAGEIRRTPYWATVVQRAQAAPETLTPTDVLTLQRTIGNRATIGMLSRSTMLQAKLNLGPAGDRYEQEADRVSQQVTQPLARPQPVQRMDEERPSVSKFITRKQDRPLRKADPLTKNFFTRSVQGKIAQPTPMHGAEGGEVESSVAQQIQGARGGGKPLDKGVRAQMEQGFGADFSGVRVHTGGQADTLNRSLNAKAFTTGQDIFFGKGQYNPGSSGGQKLIAHELTHTVQQSATHHRVARQNSKTPPIVQRALDPEQQEKWVTTIQDGVRQVSEVIHQRQEMNDRDPALAELKILLRSTFRLAEAFMTDPETTDNHLPFVEALFKNLATLAGLKKGGGYVKSGLWGKKNEKLKNASLKSAAAVDLFKHTEKVYKTEEDGTGYLSDLDQIYDSDEDENEGKKLATKIGYHTAGTLMNLAFPVSLTGILGGMAVTKMRALSTKRTESILKSDRNSSYVTPLGNFRTAVGNIQGVVAGLSPVQGVAGQVMTHLEKFLKKRNAQGDQPTRQDNSTLAGSISKKWMTKELLTGLLKFKYYGKGGAERRKNDNIKKAEKKRQAN